MARHCVISLADGRLWTGDAGLDIQTAGLPIWEIKFHVSG